MRINITINYITTAIINNIILYIILVVLFSIMSIF